MKTKLKMFVIISLITSINCGGFKVDLGIDDNDLSKIDETIEGFTDDSSSESDSDSDSDKSLGTYNGIANTCVNDSPIYKLPRLIELYLEDKKIFLYNKDQEIIASGEVIDSETIELKTDLTDVLTDDQNLDCSCELAIQDEFYCVCETDSDDCTFIYQYGIN